MDFIILRVNGVDVTQCTHEEAIRVFEAAQQPIVVEVLRRDSGEDNAGEYDGRSGNQSVGVQATEEDASNGKRPPLTPDNDLLEMIYEDVVLQKSHSDQKLGLTLCYKHCSGQECEVYVGAVAPHSLAAAAGHIYRGDQILKINKEDVVSQKQVERCISQIGVGNVTLTICRPYHDLMDEEGSSESGLGRDSEPLQGESSGADSLPREPREPEVATSSVLAIDKHLQQKLKQMELNVEKQAMASKENQYVNEMLLKSVDDEEKLRRVKVPCQKSEKSKKLPSEGEAEHIYESIVEHSESEHIYDVPYESSRASKSLPRTKRRNCDNRGGSGRKINKEGRKSGTSHSLDRCEGCLKNQVQNKEDLPHWVLDPIQTTSNMKVTSWLQRTSQFYKDSDIVLCDKHTSKKLAPENNGQKKRVGDQTKPHLVTEERLLLRDNNINKPSVLVDYSKDDSNLAEKAKEKNQKNKDKQVKTRPKNLVNVPMDTMYTTQEHLQHTIQLQQHLFRNAIIQQQQQQSANNDGGENYGSVVMRLPKPPATQYQYVSSHVGSTLELVQKSFSSAMLQRTSKDNGQSERVNRRSSDISRDYNKNGHSVRRSHRKPKDCNIDSNIIAESHQRTEENKRREVEVFSRRKKREERINQERGGQSTDDDTLSELKVGRYWNKDQRKRHIEHARERRRRQEEVIAFKTGDQTVDTRTSPDSATTSYRRRIKEKPFDDFTTLQELLVHGNTEGKAVGGLLTVTTV